LINGKPGIGNQRKNKHRRFFARIYESSTGRQKFQGSLPVSPRKNSFVYYFQVLYKLNEEAKNFFKSQLKEAQNKKASDYLVGRGLKPETISEFEIGFAPAGFETLTMHLTKLKYSIDDIIRSGLSFKTERGMIMDRFRNRIMFPLENNFGKIIGFTGRLLPEFDDGKTGKYVNSPETPIYVKSKFLYGLYKSKSFIRSEGALIVEGQMDYLMSWQAGVKNCVATSGTALTADHLSLLSRLTDKLIFSFDNDEAGFSALERAIDLATTYDFNVKVLKLPEEYKDPAEMAEKKPEELKKITASAEEAMEFYFRRYLPDRENFEISEFKKSIRAITSKIKKISSPVERDYWLKKLSEKTGVDMKVLAEEMDKIKSVDISAAGQAGPEEKERAKISRQDLIGGRILSLISANDYWEKGEQVYPYLSSRYQRVFEILKNNKHKSDDPSVDGLIEEIHFATGRSEDPEKEIDKLKKELQKEYFREKKKIILGKLKKLEAGQNNEETEKALKEFDALTKEELNLNSSDNIKK
jgi:DNA primase